MKTLKQLLKLSIFIWAFIAFSGCSKEDFHEMDEPGLLVPRTVDEDLELPSITLNGTMLHAEAYGNPEDPMIVAIHGGPGGDYRSLLPDKFLLDRAVRHFAGKIPEKKTLSSQKAKRLKIELTS